MGNRGQENQAIQNKGLYCAILQQARKSLSAMACALLIIFAAVGASEAEAYTANKVWFMFKPYGGYRVYVNYTVPALKEFREAYVEFNKKKEAEAYYWKLVKGADFYLPDPKSIRFTNQELKPEPW